MATAAPGVEVLQMGDRAVCTVTFTVGTPAAAPSVRPTCTWRVWPPGATVATVYVSGVAPEATPVAGNTGGFALSVPCSAGGTWNVHVAATGSCEGAELGRFFVQGTPS